jgi:hypothetical protein
VAEATGTESYAVAALQALVAAAEAATEEVALSVDARRQEAEDRLGAPAGDDMVLVDPEFGAWLERYRMVRDLARTAQRALAAWTEAGAA